MKAKCGDKWGSFHEVDDPVGLGTILHHAKTYDLLTQDESFDKDYCATLLEASRDCGKRVFKKWTDHNQSVADQTRADRLVG